MSVEPTTTAPNSSPLSPDGLCRQHATTLQELFDGTLTPRAAATKLSKITIPNPRIRRHRYAYSIQLLFENIISSLHTHPHRVETVADLIISISQLPPIWAKSDPGAPKHFIPDENTCIWDDDGSTFARILNDKWERECQNRYPVMTTVTSLIFASPNTDLTIPTAETTKRQAVIDGFVAVNELVATLILYDEERFKYHLFLLWSLRSALERPSWVVMAGDRKAILECYVKAAAKLIEIAGPEIRHWEHEYEHGPLVGDPGSGGDLWQGKGGFCKDRWELWRRRFGELSVEEGLGAEARGCAMRAGEMMAEIDD